MELQDLSHLVRETMETVRESLARIEAAAQVDEDPRLLMVSRGYAMLIVPLRDYLSGSQIGKPLPRQLARRLNEASGPLLDLQDLIDTLGLHPDLQELAQLVREAESAS